MIDTTGFSFGVRGGVTTCGGLVVGGLVVGGLVVVGLEVGSSGSGSSGSGSSGSGSSGSGATTDMDIVLLPELPALSVALAVILAVTPLLQGAVQVTLDPELVLKLPCVADQL